MAPSDSELTETALAAYVAARLALFGPAFADEELVREALTYDRDLWVKLYEIDRDYPALAPLRQDPPPETGAT